ncbi:hypothetical protein CEXT_418071 [Caerostris extrusa]|uniref:Uncharacterized protein n=1 Tax=Caerostris extrusa TaxID=172846 RepID=A0AAV4WF06_CAEEX|nr:hypothetical protein CEXT_418071 [Caerostris extrusa]
MKELISEVERCSISRLELMMVWILALSFHQFKFLRIILDNVGSRTEGTALVENVVEAMKVKQRDEFLPSCGPRSRGETRLHSTEFQTGLSHQ